MKYNDVKEAIKRVIEYQTYEENIKNYVDCLADDVIADKFTDSAYDAIMDSIDNDDAISVEVYPQYSRIGDNNITVIGMGEVEEQIETDLTPKQLKAIIKKLNDDNEINNDMYASSESIMGGNFSIFMQPGDIHIDLIDGSVVKSAVEDREKMTLSLDAFKKLLK